MERAISQRMDIISTMETLGLRSLNTDKVHIVRQL